jgi:hypothetical protein
MPKLPCCSCDYVVYNYKVLFNYCLCMYSNICKEHYKFGSTCTCSVEWKMELSHVGQWTIIDFCVVLLHQLLTKAWLGMCFGISKDYCRIEWKFMYPCTTSHVGQWTAKKIYVVFYISCELMWLYRVYWDL